MAPIPEHPEYLIDEGGRVFSTKSNKYLKPYLSSSGYLRVGLYSEGKVKHYLISRLLARVYLNLESLDSEDEVDHIDTDILNNRIGNLQVLSKKNHRLKTLLDKGLKENTAVCIDCGVPLDNKTCVRCRPCFDKSRILLPDISEKDIKTAVLEQGSWVKAGKLFGVSDNGLRKMYKRVSGGKDPKLLKKQINASIV